MRGFGLRASGFGLIAVIVAACTAAPPQATALDAQRANVAVSELRDGRQLLIEKCGASCHKVPLPSEHSALEWPRKLDEMSVRAGLDARQRALIEMYLVTMAAKR